MPKQGTTEKKDLRPIQYDITPRQGYNKYFRIVFKNLETGRSLYWNGDYDPDNMQKPVWGQTRYAFYQRSSDATTDESGWSAKIFATRYEAMAYIETNLQLIINWYGDHGTLTYPFDIYAEEIVQKSIAELQIELNSADASDEVILEDEVPVEDKLSLEK